MTLKNQMDEFISFANILADESAKVIMKYFRQNIKIENKDDDILLLQLRIKNQN